MLRALAVTGGVITSAGIVLAGTFSVLAVLPLVFLTEIGFVVAFGVLLDTFLVRSVLVPALDAGDWARRSGGRPRSCRTGAGEGERRAACGAASAASTRRRAEPQGHGVEAPCAVARTVAAGLAAGTDAELRRRQAEQLELAVVGVAARLVAHPAHGHPGSAAGCEQRALDRGAGGADGRAQPEGAVAPHLVERQRPVQPPRGPRAHAPRAARARPGGRASRCRCAPRRPWPRARRRRPGSVASRRPASAASTPSPEALSLAPGAPGVVSLWAITMRRQRRGVSSTPITFRELPRPGTSNILFGDAQPGAPGSGRPRSAAPGPRRCSPPGAGPRWRSAPRWSCGRGRWGEREGQAG